MAAGIATMDVYKEQRLFERAAELAPYLEDAVHSLKGLPNVVDIRNIGMMAAVELAAVPGAPVKRAFDVFDRCFDHGVFVRVAGPVLAFSPPLISEKHHIDQLVDVLGKSIKESAEKMK
jgi:beta-alanine--pyruvate transaminase